MSSGLLIMFLVSTRRSLMVPIYLFCLKYNLQIGRNLLLSSITGRYVLASPMVIRAGFTVFESISRMISTALVSSVVKLPYASIIGEFESAFQMLTKVNATRQKVNRENTIQLR